MKKVCSRCTLAVEDPSANFCPNCGGKVITIDDQPSSPGPKACRNCGNVAVDPEMNFCAKCGSALKDAGVNQAPTPAYVTPSPQPAQPAYIIHTPEERTIIPLSPSKFYGLGSLFTTPHATVRVNNKKNGGKLVLAREGIAFKGRGVQHSSIIGTQGGVGIRFLIPFKAIENVSLGKKDNSFIVYLVDGDSREFKLYNPKKWVEKIREQMGD